MSSPDGAGAGWMKSMSGWPLMLALLAASLAIGDSGPITALDSTIRQYQLALLVSTGTVTLIGFMVFFIGAFLLLLGDDADTTPDGANGQQVRGLARLRKLPHTLRASAYQFSGQASTVQAEDTFSIADLKRAGSSRWSNPVSRRRSIAVIGGVMMVFGGFGCAFIAVPRGLKPLIGVFVLYALVRLSWGYYKAR
jgi:hypothetical protein